MTDAKIKKILCEDMQYEVGEGDVASIEPSDQGSKKLNMYKVTFEDGGVLFVGMLEHGVEYMEDEI